MPLFKKFYLTHIKFLLLSAGALLFSACGMSKPDDRLKELYGGVASDTTVERNPVIVIPGILGSKLRDQTSGIEVWGAFVPGAASPRDPASVRLIGLPMQEGKSLRSLTDNVKPNGALDRVRLRILPGINISPRAYAQILGLLGAGGYADETLGRVGAINYGHDHYSCFQFSYDWRRSSADNAELLHQFIESKRAAVMAQRKKRGLAYKPVKFDIVAHSMGGLLARYYLRYGTQKLPQTGTPKLTWAGAKHIDKVVLIGSPHFGSPKAINELTKGFKPTPFTALYDPCLLGTMPSVYELLPRKRHGLLRDENSGATLDPLDPELWKSKGWGLANTKYHKTLQALLPKIASPQERMRVALDHQRKCLQNARRFHRALDRPAKAPSHLKIVTWVGDSGPTLTYLSATAVEPKRLNNGRGDGTVPRFSAIADERGPAPTKGMIKSPVPWADINYIYRDHLGLTKDVNFSDNLLAFLLNQGGSVGSE